MNRFTIILLLLLSPAAGDAEETFYWHESTRLSYCEDPFVAGFDLYDRPLYVSQVSVEQYKCQSGVKVTCNPLSGECSPPTPTQSCTQLNDTWHIGKAGAHLNEGMSFSYGGKEYDVGDRPDIWPDLEIDRDYSHFTLCLTESGKFLQEVYGILRWVRMSEGAHPQNAIRGFNRKERQIVCRAEHPSSHGPNLTPGKLIPRARGCLIGFAGKEEGKRQYEVLTLDIGIVARTIKEQKERDLRRLVPSLALTVF